MDPERLGRRAVVTAGLLGASGLGAPGLGTATASAGAATASAGAAPGGAMLVLPELAPGVGLGNAGDDTRAMHLALEHAARRPGSIILLPPGRYVLISPGAGGLPIPSWTTLRGAGMNQVEIAWNDDDGCNLFTAAVGGPNGERATDIVFEDLGIVGSRDRRGATSLLVEEGPNHPGGRTGFPVVLRNVDGLTLRRVSSTQSRLMGLRADRSSRITVEDCSVALCSGDGINVSASSDVAIIGNRIRHVDDDGIAAHSTTHDPGGVRAGLSIVGNSLFDTQGISVIAGRSASIVGNVLEFCKAYGISLATRAPGGGAGGDEGQAASQAVVIASNVITNLISREGIDGRAEGCPGILVTGSSARPGAGADAPDRAARQAATLDPYRLVRANSGDPGQGVPPTRGIVVSGNIIARQVPPADGSVPGFARVSDWGASPQGVFTATGWFDGPLALDRITDYGVRVVGGSVRDMLVSGNQISGMAGGLDLSNSVRLDNIQFRGNQVTDFRLAGVAMRTFGIARVHVEDNLFDGDPFLSAPARGPLGSWAAGPDGVEQPVGVRIDQVGGGLFLRRNSWKNLFRIADLDSAQPHPAIEFIDNIAEAWPCATGYDPRNRGIGVIDREGGVRWSIVDAAPGEGGFGTVIQPVALSAVAQPTAGIWVQGRLLRNAAPAIEGGHVVLGWLRLTTGGGNEPGLDWATLTAPAGVA